MSDATSITGARDRRWLILGVIAVAHGYDTAFWWTAGIFAGGAVVGGALLRRGPLYRKGLPSEANGRLTTAQGPAGPVRPA